MLCFSRIALVDRVKSVAKPKETRSVSEGFFDFSNTPTTRYSTDLMGQHPTGLNRFRSSPGQRPGITVAWGNAPGKTPPKHLWLKAKINSDFANVFNGEYGLRPIASLPQYHEGPIG